MGFFLCIILASAWWHSPLLSPHQNFHTMMPHTSLTESFSSSRTLTHLIPSRVGEKSIGSDSAIGSRLSCNTREPHGSCFTHGSKQSVELGWTIQSSNAQHVPLLAPPSFPLLNLSPVALMAPVGLSAFPPRAFQHSLHPKIKSNIRLE